MPLRISISPMSLSPILGSHRRVAAICCFRLSNAVGSGAATLASGAERNTAHDDADAIGTRLRLTTSCRHSHFAAARSTQFRLFASVPAGAMDRHPAGGPAAIA